MHRASAAYVALPCATAAATFLITWISPDALGDRMVQDLTCLMILEFVMMHAGAFLSALPTLARSRKVKIAIVSILALAYSIFAIGMPLAWDAPWLIGGFVTLVAGKLLAAWRLPSRKQSVAQSAVWGCAIASYILFVALAALFPFPHFGITAKYVRLPNGAKFPNPHSIIAAGFLYWVAQAVTQFLVQKRMGPRAPERVIVHVQSRDPVASGYVRSRRSSSTDA